jgi:hypothetical protein
VRTCEIAGSHQVYRRQLRSKSRLFEKTFA